MKRTKEEKEQAKKMLAKLLRAGKYRVYTSLESVSRSGMQRKIKLYVATGKGEIRWIGGYASTLCDWRQDHKSGAIVVNGCGMDMGFHLVNNLSMAMYCPKKYEHDKAYTLSHEWL